MRSLPHIVINVGCVTAAKIFATPRISRFCRNAPAKISQKKRYTINIKCDRSPKL
ncbi:hypothetical protein FDUTEX481_07385 [Tolypothrix sp. PCC 7601]|nr:hypothetical protein FDUTEX481_07385 [Tolypothrix sp. PCC 7601]